MEVFPYRSSSARDMIARQLTSTGSRAAGRMPVIPLNMFRETALQPMIPNTNVLSGLGCNDVSYQAAKRMSLGRLGIAAGGPPVGAGAGAGAAIGASQGATYGAYAGPIGSAIGAVIGAIGGAIAGSINKKDPEEYNFSQAVAIWQQNPDGIYAIGNKYLPLAGMFDLNIKTNIPIYKKYGHMGEERFTADLVRLLSNAGLTGQISANDTPISVMQRIVQPWIDSWGYGPMQDPHADMITRLMIGMILDYVTGGWKTAWRARSGDIPVSFRSLPEFKMAAPAPPAVTPVPAAAPRPPINLTPAPAPAPAPAPVQMAPAIVIPAPAPTTLLLEGKPAPTATAPAATPVATIAAAPPSGFTQIGTDASGNPVFTNPQGVLYSWNGSAMQMFNGSLMSSGAGAQSMAAQLQAAIQQALAAGQSAQQAAQSAIAQAQSQGIPVSPAVQSQVAEQAAATAAAPQVTAASSGPTGSLGVAGVALAIVGLLFATARPAKGGRRA